MTVKRVWLAAAAVVAAVVGFGAITVFAWTISEAHFDRPDEGFDRLVSQIDGLAGVNVDTTERWVEAPTFSQPMSWVDLRVDRANLPGLLGAACAAEYADPVIWSLRVRTQGGDVVSLHVDPAAPDGAGGSRCIDVGFDAVGLVEEVDDVRPGVDLQASLGDGGRFTLVSLVDGDSSLPDLLPLVAHASDLRAAAGLGEGLPVEINGADLSLIVEPGEDERYAAHLSALAEEHGVTSFWADGGGTPIDGVEKVQIVAPEAEHAAIEAAIRASGLHIADLPVRFSSPTL